MYSGTSYLRSYEAACLTAWRARLSDDARRVFSKQVEAFDMVQRLSADKLVSFHSFRNRTRESWTAAQAIYPLVAEEVTAARVVLKARGGQKSIKASIVLHDGRLSSIEFDRRPQDVFGDQHKRVALQHMGIVDHPSDVEVVECECFFDPMRAVGGPPHSVPRLTGWVKSLAEQLQAKTFSPVSAERRAELLQTIDASLPGDYIEFISETEGMTSRIITVSGSEGIRSLVFPHGNYYVLANMSGDNAVDLAVKRGEPNARLYLLDPEGQVVEELGSSFRTAIGRLIGHAYA